MSDAIDRSPLAWMPKSVWGPIKWRELHCRGLARLPMRGERAWFKSFVAGLPCEKCREHFHEFIAKCPPDFKTRRRFFTWGIRAHNAVNRKRHLKEWKTRTARAVYEEMMNYG